MIKRTRWLLGCSLLGLALSGCPVTDDYYIESGKLGGSAGAQANGGTGDEPSGGSGQAGSKQAGSDTGGMAQAGKSGDASGGTSGNATSGSGGTEAGVDAGGSNMASAGAPDAGAPPLGDAGAAGMPPVVECTPAPERCNGHDDNCNEVSDEDACNSQSKGTSGCSGFIVPSRPMHGYMLCTGTTRDYSHAQEACQAQGMRLAWIETSDENVGVSTKVNSLTQDVEVWIGANDIANEGKWYWDGSGGVQFWNGNENGKVVGGATAAWAQGTPNNGSGSAGGGEDCAVLTPGAATWGDRSCYIKYSYLCEDAEP